MITLQNEKDIIVFLAGELADSKSGGRVLQEEITVLRDALSSAQQACANYRIEIRKLRKSRQAHKALNYGILYGMNYSSLEELLCQSYTRI